MSAATTMHLPWAGTSDGLAFHAIDPHCRQRRWAVIIDCRPGRCEIRTTRLYTRDGTTVFDAQRVNVRTDSLRDVGSNEEIETLIAAHKQTAEEDCREVNR